MLGAKLPPDPVKNYTLNKMLIRLTCTFWLQRVWVAIAEQAEEGITPQTKVDIKINPLHKYSN